MVRFISSRDCPVRVFDVSLVFNDQCRQLYQTIGHRFELSDQNLPPNVTMFTLKKRQRNSQLQEKDEGIS